MSTRPAIVTGTKITNRNSSAAPIASEPGTSKAWSANSTAAS
jgi:hypothetical protein